MIAPMLIFLLCGVAILIVGLLRRKFLLAAFVAGIFAFGIAYFAILSPLEEAITVLGFSIRFDSRWIILGRSFLLDSSNRASIGFLFFSGGFILLGAWTARPERMFFSLGIGTLALVAASLMIEPFLYAAIFLELAAITSSIMLSARKHGRNRGGLRLLVLYSMAMLAILLVGWILDVNQQDIELHGLSIRATLLLGFGFSILLTIPPFHSWIPISAGENHPFAWAFIATILQAAGFFFIVRFMNNYLWLNESVNLFDALRTVGAIMAVVGALWAIVQDDLRKMASYAVVSDIGIMLIAFGIGSQEGLQLALVLTVARVVSIAVLAQGLNGFYSDRESEHQTQQGKEGSFSVLRVAAVLIGMVSLAGLPLSAGFPGRWEVIGILAKVEDYAWVAMLFSMLVLSLASIKCAHRLLNAQNRSSLLGINTVERVFLWGGIVVTLIVGILPQMIFPWIIVVIEGLA